MKDKLIFDLQLFGKDEDNPPADGDHSEIAKKYKLHITNINDDPKYNIELYLLNPDTNEKNKLSLDSSNSVEVNYDDKILLQLPSNIKEIRDKYIPKLFINDERVYWNDTTHAYKEQSLDKPKKFSYIIKIDNSYDTNINISSELVAKKQIKKSKLKTKIHDGIVTLHLETEVDQVEGLKDEYYDKDTVDKILHYKQDKLTMSDTVSLDDKTNPITPYGVAKELEKYSTSEDIENTFTSYYKKDEIDKKLSDKQNNLTIDGIPTDNSNNPVSSSGVYNALLGKVDNSDMSNYVTQTKLHDELNKKQNNLIFDHDITKDSKNIVSSGVVYGNIDKINKKVDAIHIPTKISELDNDKGYLTSHQDISGKQDRLTFDDSPTENSDNPVKSKGIKKYVDDSSSKITKDLSNKIDKLNKDLSSNINTSADTKQDKLTFDDIPKTDSDNPVKSKGIKKYVDDSIDSIRLTVEDIPTDKSKNPITSGAVYTALTGKLDNSALDGYAKITDVTKITDNKMNSIPVDNEVTKDSLNLITSGGVYSYVKTVSDAAISSSSQIKDINTKLGNIETNIKTNEDTIKSNNDKITKDLDNYKKSNDAEIRNIKDNYTTNDKLSKTINDLKKDAKTDLDNKSKEIIDKMPTKISELDNDKGYLTSHQDISGKQDRLTFDESPTENSDNPVKSKGIKSYIDNIKSSLQTSIDSNNNTTSDKINSEINKINNALKTKQNNLTFDNTPKFGSNNPVTSTGVKEYIDNQISSIPKFKIEVVTSLPSYPSSTSIYLLKDNNSDEDGNVYDEYIYVNNKWEQLGAQKLDLSGYATVDSVKQLQSSKQDKLSFDDTPSEQSTNILTSGTIYESLSKKVDKSDMSNYTPLNKFNTEINKKQDTLTFDSDITKNSSNIVTSGTIYNNIDKVNNKINAIHIPTKVSELDNDKGYLIYHQDISGKQDKLTFDESPTDNSNNPVKSKGIKKYVDDKASELSANVNKLISESNSSINNINGLKDKLDSKQDKLTFDNIPTDNSDNPVKSKGIKSYIDTGIETIKSYTEQFPLSSSKKFMTSGDIYNALQHKLDNSALDGYAKITDVTKITDTKMDKMNVDTAVEKDSKNLITSGAVHSYIKTLNDAAVESVDRFNNIDRSIKDINNSINTTNTKIDNYKESNDTEIRNIKNNYTSNEKLGKALDKLRKDNKTDLDNKAKDIIGNIPTKVSQLKNDSGYLTEHQDISGKQDKLTFDEAPTENSDNLVKSGVLYKFVNDTKVEVNNKTDTFYNTLKKVTDTHETEIKNKQNKLTFDKTPTKDSDNPVTSDGIKSAIDAESKTLMDKYKLVTNSLQEQSNFVNNTLVPKLDKKQDKLTFDKVPTEGSNNPVTSDGISAILKSTKGSLNTKIDNEIGKIKTTINTQTADINKKQDRLTFDEEPTDNSDNPVYSKGIKKYVDDKSSELSIKISNIHIPTNVSELDNDKGYLTSQDISGKQDKLTFDIAPTEDSDNVVYSKGIKKYVDDKASELNTNISDVLSKNNDVSNTVSSLTNKVDTKQDKLTFDDTPTDNSSNPVTSTGIKKYVDNQVSSIPKFKIEVVEELPSDPSPASIYLLKNLSTTDTQNMYDEFIYVNKRWEKLGTQKIDLSGYATEEVINKILNSKQDKLTFDDAPKADSNNPVYSKGIKKYIDDKNDETNDSITSFVKNDYYDKTSINHKLDEYQKNLTFDESPTENSNNPVKSKGIKKYVDDITRVNDHLPIDNESDYDTGRPLSTSALINKFNTIDNSVSDLNKKLNNEDNVINKQIYPSVKDTVTDIDNPIETNNKNAPYAYKVDNSDIKNVSSVRYSKLLWNKQNIYTAKMINDKANEIYEETSKQIPRKISDIENDKKFITKDDASSIVSKTLGEFDSTPTEGSNKLINSGNIKKYVDTKQDKLTFDDTPKDNSDNPVTSKGIKNYVDTKQDKLTFDDTPKDNSDNPVKSSGIKKYVEDSISNFYNKSEVDSRINNAKPKLKVIDQVTLDPKATIDSDALYSASAISKTAIKLNNDISELDKKVTNNYIKNDRIYTSTMPSYDSVKIKLDKVSLDNKEDNNPTSAFYTKSLYNLQATAINDLSTKNNEFATKLNELSDKNDTLNNTINTKVADLQDKINNNKVEIDNDVSKTSDHAVKSSGIYKFVTDKLDENKSNIKQEVSNNTYSKKEIDDKLSNKQNKLTIDTGIKKDSNNPISSGAVYSKTRELDDNISNLNNKLVDKSRVYHAEASNLEVFHNYYRESDKIPTYKSMFSSMDLYETRINTNTDNKIEDVKKLIKNSSSDKIPTKVSQLENDKGYLTEHQDISGKVDKSDLGCISVDDLNDVIHSVFEIKGITDIASTDYYLKSAPSIQEKAKALGIEMLFDNTNNFMIIDFSKCSDLNSIVKNNNTVEDNLDKLSVIQFLFVHTPGYMKTHINGFPVIKDKVLNTIISWKRNDNRTVTALYLTNTRDLIKVKISLDHGIEFTQISRDKLLDNL